MRYDGLHYVNNKKVPHLGGNVAEGDPHTFAPRVWDYIISRFAINSVLDLGSGLGYSADYFYKKGLKVVAVDGLLENIMHAFYPTIQLDITKNIVNCQVDLVHCHEVVEHIEECYLDNLLKSLCSGRIILMTNALPGQTGHFHVNEQKTEYWIEHLKRYDCELLYEDTMRIRALAKLDKAGFLAKSGTVFANNSRL